MNKTTHILAHILTTAALSACSSGSAPEPAEGRDSLYTAEHIEEIAFSKPEEALSLLDKAEEEKLLSPFEISDLRCLVYHNGLSRYKTAYTHALKAYHDPEARNYPEKFLSLVAIMAEESHNNGDYTGSVEHCAEGLALARTTGDRTIEANLHVTWGLNLLEMEQYDGAFSRIDHAIGILEEEVRREPCFRTWDELFYALGMKLSLLWDKDRYEEALALRPRLEEALRGLETSEDTPEGSADMRRAETDVCYSCIAYSLGNKAEGDSLYRRVASNPYTSTPDGEYLHIPSLLMAKRYDEALRYLKREKRLLQESTDTVNWDYINPHLQMELEAWQGKGNWKESSRVQGVMLALTDTLRKRERHEDALELAEIYKSKEKDVRIKEKERIAGLWMSVAAATLLLLAAAGGFTTVIVRKNKEISKKNATLAARLNETVCFRDEAFRKQEEIIALQKQVAQLSARLPETAGKESSEDACPPADDMEVERRIFYRIKYEIEKRELFLQKDFDKEAFAKEMNLSARKMGKLFTTFAGNSLSEYIQGLRMDYSLSILRDNPNWTIESVAEKCGMPLRTFHRLFAEKFGMTPQVYRKNKSESQS